MFGITHHFRVVSLTFRAGSVALVLAFCCPALATEIMVDPGAVGSMYPFNSIPFSDLNGTVLSGQSVDLDFVFSDMKHVELDFFADPSPSFTTFAAVSLILDFNTADLPPFLQPQTSFLSNELGDPILGPAVPHTFRDNGLAGLTAPQPNHNDHEGLMFHDVHFSFSFADEPDLQVTGGRLELEFFDPPNGDFIVGEWIPEPNSCVLFLLGFITFAGAGRRRLAH